jgi:endoglucanase
MKRRYFPTGVAVLLLLLLNTVSVVHSQATGVSDARFARLAKGVNITRWFWLNDDSSDRHYKDYVSDDQLQQLRDAGFTHVRLPVEPTYLLNESDPSHPVASRLATIKAAVERITSHDLAVIIDLHNWQADFNARLMNNPQIQQDFADMWQAVAAYFSDTDPEMVFFEVMNEPHPDDPTLWSPIQAKVVKAIREGAPDHTIIVGGAGWNSIDGLKMLQPLDDANVIYNFHFYEPFVFTHQGASWEDVVNKLYDIPYPSTNGRCGNLPNFHSNTANDWANWYCTQDTWDVQRIDQRIKEAVDWANQYDVRLICDEFGVNPLVAPPDDRLQWFSDVRSTLEKYNIGWTVWGYDDAMGFGFQPNRSSSALSPQLLKTLGL